MSWRSSKSVHEWKQLFYHGREARDIFQIIFPKQLLYHQKLQFSYNQQLLKKNCFPLNKAFNTTTHAVLFCGKYKYQHYVIKFISLVILKKFACKTVNDVKNKMSVKTKICVNFLVSKQINRTFYFGKIKWTFILQKVLVL